jgi:hypothetical protein
MKEHFYELGRPVRDTTKKQAVEKLDSTTCRPKAACTTVANPLQEPVFSDTHPELAGIIPRGGGHGHSAPWNRSLRSRL